MPKCHGNAIIVKPLERDFCILIVIELLPPMIKGFLLPCGQFDNVKELALVSIASMIGSCHTSAHKAICNKVISRGMPHFFAGFWRTSVHFAHLSTL